MTNYGWQWTRTHIRFEFTAETTKLSNLLRFVAHFIWCFVVNCSFWQNVFCFVVFSYSGAPFLFVTQFDVHFFFSIHQKQIDESARSQHANAIKIIRKFEFYSMLFCTWWNSNSREMKKKNPFVFMQLFVFLLNFSLFVDHASRRIYTLNNLQWNNVL